jgi:XTP/dITP diphosphohydrolase
MANPFPLVLGTHNQKKVVELRDIFRNVPIQLRSLAEFPEAIEVEETGTTFAENASLKASEQAQHLGQWVLAEDSGLSVAALDGAPGVYSARFSGDPRDDNRNNQFLLEKLQGIKPANRNAWYTCHMTLSDPQGKIWISCAGHCHGRIREKHSGIAGFGYDPLFEVVEYHRTFGELGLAVKSMISHRAIAARIFLREFQRLNPSTT